MIWRLAKIFSNLSYNNIIYILQLTINNRPLHLQVSRGESDMLTIITLYEPEQTEWINYSQRRL